MVYTESFIQIPLQSAQMTYQADPQDFSAAVRVAVNQLMHDSGDFWMLDGWKSDRLYLRLKYGRRARELGLPRYLDQEFEISHTPPQITVSVLTRETHLLDLFERFAYEMNHLLPQRSP